MAKIISKEEAAQLIQDGDVVGINGFAFGFGFPEALAKALGERYEKEGHPKGMTLMLIIRNGGLRLLCVPDITYHPPGHPAGFLGLALPFKAVIPTEEL